MKRFLLPALAAFIIVGCKGSTVLSYDLIFDIEETGKQNILSLASMRVIERRLANIGEEAIDLGIAKKNGTTRITVELENEIAAEIIHEELTTPFKLRIMSEAEDTGEEEAEDGEEAEAERDVSHNEIFVEGHGVFLEAGITEEHIRWLEASEEAGGKGRVTISFTEEGRDAMESIFSESEGKIIGLFVRERLVSKLLVSTDTLEDEIVITDIPTVELARIFADDVNVGLYVTFSPVE